MAKHQSSHQARESNAEGNGVKGVEAYAYDPTLRLESLQGLDRLRCFADRALAADFFAVFRAAERNTESAVQAERERAQRRDAKLQSLRTLAARAFEGELGPQSKELAAHMLLDERGSSGADERALQEFARALRDLRRLSQ
jgi:hypothetical protein